MTDFIDLKAIASRVVELQKREQMNSKEFAERCELSPSTLSQVLNGKTNINVESINKIIRHMPDVDPLWLLLGDTPDQASNVRYLAQTTNADLPLDESALILELREQAGEIAKLRLKLEEYERQEIDKIMIFRKDNSFATYRQIDDK